MSTRRICFTQNNYTDDSIQALLDETRFSYVIFGKEVGKEGTPHLQGYAEFHKKTKYAGIAKIHKMHCEVTQGTALQAADYCKKDGDWIEKGEMRDDSGAKGGEIEKARWARNIKLAEEGKFDELKEADPQAYTRSYSTYHKMHKDAMPEPPVNDTLNNEWIWGPSGVGKSRSVRDQHPILYPKPRNKWWDGYKDQEVVLIEEVCPKDAEWIGSFLKQWSDHYPFIADIKCSARMIRPKKIIITSNYSMEEVFQDINDLEPLKRRFKQTHMLGYIGVFPPKTN